MPEFHPQPTAFNGEVPLTTTAGAITLREDAGVGFASVAVRRDRMSELESAAARKLSIEMPGTSRFTRSGALRAFWTAAGQWLFEAPLTSHPDLEHHLKDSFGDLASITEQTGGFAGFELEGTTCVSLFERLCNADVRRMRADEVLRSSIEHMGTYILCNEPGRSFSLRGPGSSAASLHHALMTMAQSIK